MESVIFIGLQASGKSTFYNQEFFYTHMRINLDMLKRRSREEQFVKTCLQTKQKFVVDNTNLTKPSRFHYLQDAMLNDFEVIGYYFRVDVARSLKWNSGRKGKARVPDKAILGSYKRLELPSYEEGFDKLFYVTLDTNQQFIIEDWRDEI